MKLLGFKSFVKLNKCKFMYVKVHVILLTINKNNFETLLKFKYHMSKLFYSKLIKIIMYGKKWLIILIFYK